jgi:hypothetical protein
LGELGVDGKVISKWIIKDVRAWTGSIWIIIGTSDELV